MSWVKKYGSTRSEESERSRSRRRAVRPAPRGRRRQLWRWDVGENFSVGGVGNVEGFTVFVRNSLVVNQQAVTAVGKVIRMGIAGIFHGGTS